MIINIGQTFKFAVSDSFPIVSDCFQLHTLHDTMDIIGPILPNFVGCQQSFDSVCNNYEVGLIGKIVLSVSIMALLVSRAAAEWNFLGRIGHT